MRSNVEAGSRASATAVESDRSGVVPRRNVAVLIPCYNEELTVGAVVRQFRETLPEADIYVFDNNSTDRTIEEARAAGALVVREGRQGKGYVVQSMFYRVDADVYVMVDGDATYDPKAVRALLAPVLDGEADMVVGSRLHGESASEFRALNRMGNRMFLAVLNGIFDVRLTDILSGYRAFSRDFVKNVPLFAAGFQIEVELTIKALERGYRIVEVPTNLISRPEGSFSKIKHFHDGVLILAMIMSLFRDYKPLTFFGGLGILLFGAGLIFGAPVILEFFKTGLVPRLPSAVLAVGFVLSGLLTMAVGLVLHTTVRRFQELEHQLRTTRGSVPPGGSK